MKAMYSMRSPAVKRLMKEAQELREPTELYHTQPLEDNLFEWHFTIRGPENSDFEGGIYHGRIILPPEYPMKPPNVILLTPNGRFETNKKICLSISGHHPESWQPSWSIRTALLAIIGFMPTHGGGAIGSLDYPSEDRKKLAKRSADWKCEHCGDVATILKPLTEASKAANEEAKELATQINFRGEKSTSESKSTTESTSSSTNSTPITTPPNTPVSTNHTFPSLPSMPGQFPFPPFPFPQQFGHMPNGTQSQHQGSNFVPRFPYPPQFLPSMFAQTRMPFGTPFPFSNQNAGFQTTNSVVPINQSGANAGGNASGVNCPQSSSEQSTSVDRGSSSSVTGESSNVTSTSDRDTASLTETIRSEHDPVSSTSQTQSSDEGLRQRNIDSGRTGSQPNRSFIEQYTAQPAELEPEPRNSGLRISSIVIVLLLIGIILLVFRRIYLQRMWRLPF